MHVGVQGLETTRHDLQFLRHGVTHVALIQAVKAVLQKPFRLRPVGFAASHDPRGSPVNERGPALAVWRRRLYWAAPTSDNVSDP